MGAAEVPHGCRMGAAEVPHGCRMGAAEVPHGCRMGTANFQKFVTAAISIFDFNNMR